MPPHLGGRAGKKPLRVVYRDHQLTEMMTARLKLSGLDIKDAEVLLLQALSAAEVTGLHPVFRALPAIKIPYCSTDGQPLSGWPGWPPFYRLRYLDTGAGGFAQLTKDKKKLPRYAQEPQSGVCAYFPLNGRWGAVMADTHQEVFITEGEFKAAKACKEGFPTIGLGGVFNFRSSAFGKTFIDELEAFNWVKRAVYIVFDSDATTNPNVCNALNQLAEVLRLRGAFPYVIILPPLLDDAKTGLDDFLVAEGRRGLEQYVDAAEPLTFATRLWKMNEEVVLTRRSHMIVDLRNGSKMTIPTFKDAFANTLTPERVMRKDGEISMREVAAASPWISWPLRAEIEDVTYKPGQPEFCQDDEGWWYNTWTGWGVSPKPGDVSPFTDLLEHLFHGAEQEALLWFVQWMAYPLQYPGMKLFSSVVIHGIKHGTGKSLLGYTLGKIYGKNFVEIRQSDLHSAFTEWAEAKQFILGDEIAGSDRRADADMLKQLITQKELRVNRKFIPSYTVPDCINYLFTSNHPDSFFLDDNDRRFFIHEVTVDPFPEDVYQEYNLWLDTGGAANIFHYLLAINTESFNPAGRAYYTQAKDRMIQGAKSDVAAWVARLLIDPVTTLTLGRMRVRGDIMTSKELLNIYDNDHRTKVTANGLGRELSKAGFLQVNNGQPIRTPNGLDRYWIVQRREKWQKASLAVISNYLGDLHKGSKFIDLEQHEDEEDDE